MPVLNACLRRREFLAHSFSAMALAPLLLRAAERDLPRGNPLPADDLPWTKEIAWNRVVDVSTVPGASIAERLGRAQALLTREGGGVVYFPPGRYVFSDSIRLEDGIVLRGAPPSPVTDARNPAYRLGTRLEFPRYEPLLQGDGTPIASAFKGIHLAEPASASRCGLVHLELDFGHIRFDEGPERQAGTRRLVFGCILRHAAVADPSVPDLELGQHPWQRFTRRHAAAIDIKAEADILVANNRLPRSGEANFSMDGFVLRKGRATVVVDGVVFDYDNRPGLYINHYSLGGPGGNGPDGTPDTHPHGFRKGIVIRDNYIFNTGRMAIGFSGDGTRCQDNVIRFAAEVWRPTNTGRAATSGSSTNDNRAVEMRGWRWVVTGNDYEVHRNWALDRAYRINDGEGLMHEDHVNSTIRDSLLARNRGNAYLSLYKCAGIDGLEVAGNDIRLPASGKSPAKAMAIFVSADRNSGRYPCRRVRIVDNQTRNGGILISGHPAGQNQVTGNRHLGPGQARILNRAEAVVRGNEGFVVDQG